MKYVRIPMLALAIVQAVFAGLTAMVGLFADGGEVWERLVIVVLHPLAAAGLLFLVLSRRLTAPVALAIAALLLAAVAVDLALRPVHRWRRGQGGLGAPGNLLPSYPALGVVYALVLARSLHRNSPAITSQRRALIKYSNRETPMELLFGPGSASLAGGFGKEQAAPKGAWWFWLMCNVRLFVPEMASQAGFEPATRCLEGSRSVP